MVEHSSAQKHDNKKDVSSWLKETFEVREGTIIYMNSGLRGVPKQAEKLKSREMKDG